MSSPDAPRWSPARIVLWAAAAVLASIWFGPRFVEAFRPPEGRFMDFVQEWLSAKNYWAGTPVYADQTAALFRHTGYVPNRAEDMLPWNAHPPASVVLTLPLGKLGYREAHLVWNLMTAPLFLAGLWVILRELNVRLAPWSVFPAVALLLVCNPLYIQFGQGQLNPPIFLLLALAWAADRRDRPGWAGAALGLAAGLKLYPAFLFAYFLFAGRWRAVLTGAIVFAAVNGCALAVLGANEFRTYAEKVVPSLFDYQSSWRNVSLTGFWLRIFNPQSHEKIIPLVANPMAGAAFVFASRVLVTGAVAWAAWQSRSVAARDRAFAAAIVGMLLVSPVAWTHYFVLLPLPVGLLWARFPAGMLRVAMWLAVIPLWLPENFFARLAVGREQAQALINLRPASLNPMVNLMSPGTNLTALSAFNYVLMALFVLVLLVPAGAEEPMNAAESREKRKSPLSDEINETDEARLNRRLFGPDGGG